MEILLKRQLFEYVDYKKYLKDKIASDEQARGLRIKISRFIGCQPSYFSQVLNSKPHLMLEQASLINQFLQHSQIEAQYFILLVNFARAGTSDLKRHFAEQMSEVQKAQFHLKTRFKKTGGIPISAQQKYYSAWFYSAIHVALLIPKLQTTNRLAEHFHLPVSLVADVISFFESIGLVEYKKNSLQVTQKRIHLERESDFIQRHHINWRSQALQSAEKNLPQDLHYSLVVAISEEDFIKIKEILISSIETAREVIGPSKEESIYGLTLDFFQL